MPQRDERGVGIETHDLHLLRQFPVVQFPKLFAKDFSPRIHDNEEHRTVLVE